MRHIFTFIILTFIFSGCSHNNAFTRFGMDKKEALGADSFQSTKIMSGDEIDGVFSAIYLNDVYPKAYNQNEYFYIYVFLKEKKELYDPNKLEDIDLVVKLNGKLPIKVKQLPPENQFSHLTNTYSQWNRYYLVAFAQDGKKLNLVLENGQSSSAELEYQKDEQ